MASMSEQTFVKDYPTCDFGCGRDAHYDGKTRTGPWAWMCDEHFQLHGVGLGTGRGQRLVVREEDR